MRFLKFSDNFIAKKSPILDEQENYFQFLL